MDLAAIGTLDGAIWISPQPPGQWLRIFEENASNPDIRRDQFTVISEATPIGPQVVSAIVAEPGGTQGGHQCSAETQPPQYRAKESIGSGRFLPSFCSSEPPSHAAARTGCFPGERASLSQALRSQGVLHTNYYGIES